MKVYDFVNKLKQDDTKQIKLLLSDISYRNEYNYSVLPMKACLINDMGAKKDIYFQELIDICERVPYIYVNANRSRKVFKQFMLMSIYLDECEYEGNKYYDYTINPVEQKRAVKAADSVKASVNEAIKQYRESEKQANDDVIDFEF